MLITPKKHKNVNANPVYNWEVQLCLTAEQIAATLMIAVYTKKNQICGSSVRTRAGVKNPIICAKIPIYGAFLLTAVTNEAKATKPRSIKVTTKLGF